MATNCHQLNRKKYQTDRVEKSQNKLKDRKTVLSVTLKQDGSIHRLEVIQASGIQFLDQSALQAFRMAQHFYNPPSELADSDGLIRFKFGFFLEIGGRGFRFLP